MDTETNEHTDSTHIDPFTSPYFGEERRKQLWRELREKHRTAGKSMFIQNDAYLGERLELCPDGRWFILDEQSNRIREVEPVEGVE